MATDACMRALGVALNHDAVRELAALRDAEGALSERAASLLRQAAFERGVAADARAGPAQARRRCG